MFRNTLSRSLFVPESLFYNILFASGTSFPICGNAIPKAFSGYRIVIPEANLILLFYSFSNFYL